VIGDWWLTICEFTIGGSAKKDQEETKKQRFLFASPACGRQAPRNDDQKGLLPF